MKLFKLILLCITSYLFLTGVVWYSFSIVLSDFNPSNWRDVSADASGGYAAIQIIISAILIVIIGIVTDNYYEKKEQNTT